MGGRKTTTLQAAFFILLIRFEDNGGGVVPSRATASGAGGGGCPLTQFRCATGRCVNLNVFCDGRNDCGDNSDEPAQCTRKSKETIAAAAAAIFICKNKKGLDDGNKSIPNCFPF